MSALCAVEDADSMANKCHSYIRVVMGTAEVVDSCSTVCLLYTTIVFVKTGEYDKVLYFRCFLFFFVGFDIL